MRAFIPGTAKTRTSWALRDQSNAKIQSRGCRPCWSHRNSRDALVSPCAGGAGGSRATHASGDCQTVDATTACGPSSRKYRGSHRLSPQHIVYASRNSGAGGSGAGRPTRPGHHLHCGYRGHACARLIPDHRLLQRSSGTLRFRQCFGSRSRLPAASESAQTQKVITCLIATKELRTTCCSCVPEIPRDPSWAKPS